MHDAVCMMQFAWCSLHDVVCMMQWNFFFLDVGTGGGWTNLPYLIQSVGLLGAYPIVRASAFAVSLSASVFAMANF